jgi:hypothetical protein
LRRWDALQALGGEEDFRNRVAHVRPCAHEEGGFNFENLHFGHCAGRNQHIVNGAREAWMSCDRWGDRCVQFVDQDAAYFISSFLGFSQSLTFRRFCHPYGLEHFHALEVNGLLVDQAQEVILAAQKFET